MVARAITAFLALLAIAGSAYAQDAVIYVEVPKPSHHKPYTDEQLQNILGDLESAKSDALLLYTDYASRAGNDLKLFLQNMTGFFDEIIHRLDDSPPCDDPDKCWANFELAIKRIEHDARKAAVFSGDSHHKFLLGYMIVFRVHLNKSDDYLKRCDKVIRGCGLPCETTPRVRRWRRLALEEIHRVREDIPCTKRAYRDLVSHARRKLNHLKKQALRKAMDAVQVYKDCIKRYHK